MAEAGGAGCNACRRLRAYARSWEYMHLFAWTQARAVRGSMSPGRTRRLRDVARRLRPALGARYRLVPVLARSSAACAAGIFGSKRRSTRQLGRRPRRSSTSRRRGRRDTRRRAPWFRVTFGRTTGTPSTSACICMSRSLARGAAVDAQFGRAACRRPAASLRARRRLWNAMLRARRARCAPRSLPRVRPTIDAARVGIPVRRAEPGERGDEVDAATVGNLAASASTSAAARMTASRRAATGRPRRR